MSASNVSFRLRFMSAACAGLMLIGCQTTEEPTTRVAGTVKVDGQPLKLGVISFEPEIASEQSATAEIREGKFEIESPRGRRRVSIMAYRQAKGLGPEGKPYQEQYLPPKFNLESERTIEVEEDPMLNQEFDLKSTE